MYDNQNTTQSENRITTTQSTQQSEHRTNSAQGVQQSENHAIRTPSVQESEHHRKDVLAKLSWRKNESQLWSKTAAACLSTARIFRCMSIVTQQEEKEDQM